MTHLTAISNETLFIIFNNIDKISQLAECRLVCKRWCDIAERAMLVHDTITIRSETGILRLYTLLIQHPEKAPLIKHLHFADGVKFNVWLKALLGIAVTHNIESLTGDIFTGEFCDALIDIVDKSPIKFEKLKTLTLEDDINDSYKKLSLCFVDSIETMEIHFGLKEIDWEYAARLSEFKKLRTLILGDLFDSVDDLERVLDSCSPELQNLTLMTIGWVSAHQWNQEATKKHYGLTKLT